VRERAGLEPPAGEPPLDEALAAEPAADKGP
jgi:hypothetical protein